MIGQDFLLVVRVKLTKDEDESIKRHNEDYEKIVVEFKMIFQENRRQTGPNEMYFVLYFLEVCLNAEIIGDN